MIRFHYHVAPLNRPRLGIRRGDRLCHVFSDLPDLDTAEQELLAWGRRFGPPDLRLQRRGDRRQHFDLWGAWLAICGPAAPREAVRAWLRPGT